ncbi:hypothetical protein [Pseudomonas guariconensis]|uniref:hypothetical protein n=1 Tax=Pseudomonas guariconensis TaxID=1288410 RepID=UPI0036F24BCD
MQVLVSRFESFDVELVGFARRTLVLIWQENKAFQQHFHTDRCIDHGDMWEVWACRSSAALR